MDRLRLAVVRGEIPPEGDRLRVLRSYLHENGGWSYLPQTEPGEPRDGGPREGRPQGGKPREGEPRDVGSVGGTIHMLRFVRELGVSGNREFREKTLGFLAGAQARDGSFYEVPEKLVHSPQAWLQDSEFVDRIYFTGAVAARLLSLGWLHYSLLRAAWEWLREQWAVWDEVDHTWYNWWVMLLLSQHFEGEDSERTRRCREHCRGMVADIDALPAAWFLDAAGGMGWPRDEPLLRVTQDRLRELREGDGLWHGGDIEVSLFAVGWV